MGNFIVGTIAGAFVTFIAVAHSHGEMGFHTLIPACEAKLLLRTQTCKLIAIVDEEQE